MSAKEEIGKLIERSRAAQKQIENYTQEQFKKVISDLNPDLVGFTLLTNEYELN